MNFVGGDRRSHTLGNNGHSHTTTGEDMELDDDMGDFENHADIAPGDLTQVALQYGQSLQAEYAGDERREVRTALEEIFSLMAYQNPLKESKVAHLLDRKGRVAVAEELNSAILRTFLSPLPYIQPSLISRTFRVPGQVFTRSSREPLCPDERSVGRSG